MKGFRNTTRTLSGHSFPASHGFSHSTGGTINRLAVGGPVAARDKVDTAGGTPQIYPLAGNREHGNSAVQRKISSTKELEDHGGKTPLPSGFARGGKAHFHVHKHYHAKGGKTRSVTHSYGAMEKHAETYAEGGHVHDETQIPPGPDYKKGGRARRKNAGGALYATGGTINKLAGGGSPAMPVGTLGRLAMQPRVPLRRPMQMPGGPQPPLVTRARGGLGAPAKPR